MRNERRRAGQGEPSGCLFPCLSRWRWFLSCNQQPRAERTCQGQDGADQRDQAKTVHKRFGDRLLERHLRLSVHIRWEGDGSQLDVLRIDGVLHGGREMQAARWLSRLLVKADKTTIPNIAMAS